MFLPKTSNTANWLLENFDKTEIPKMDNLPLPDALTDHDRRRCKRNRTTLLIR